MSEPVLVVFKGGALPVLAHARPQAPDKLGRALQIHVYEYFLVHHSDFYFQAFSGFFLCESRMRSGRCSSSSSSPTESCLGSATSASRSTIPSAKRTVAYAPSEARGSPFSILFKVIRPMEARSARIATGIRRRRRASRMSCPSFRSARATGIGTACDDGASFILNVLYRIHYKSYGTV